jgi:hypothetical protein
MAESSLLDRKKVPARIKWLRGHPSDHRGAMLFWAGVSKPYEADDDLVDLSEASEVMHHRVVPSELCELP